MYKHNYQAIQPENVSELSNQQSEDNLNKHKTNTNLSSKTIHHMPKHVLFFSEVPNTSCLLTVRKQSSFRGLVKISTSWQVYEQY